MKGMMLRRLAFPLALLGWVVACVEQPGARRIVGPDGTQLLHVHCGKEQVSCFQLAGERCPHGYDLSPIFDPRDGNFLVRCRMATPLVVITNNPAPPPQSRGAGTATAAISDRWPPAEVAIPAEPWPATSASAAPTPPDSARPVDLGY